MRIALIGAGNVAWHLAHTAVAAGHQVVALYSRTVEAAEALAKEFTATQVIPTPDFTSVEADIVIIAIPDAAVAAVASQVKVNAGTIVVHTSGSLPLQVLQSINDARIGVFYPLQTFTKGKPVDFKQVPVLLEAENESTLTLLKAFAQSISQHVIEVTSEKRKHLHLAAVFACNFTNHLLGISREILLEADLPATLLQPLIQETIQKAASQHPFLVQTGPAIRRDENVIKTHLHLLQNHPQYQQLYQQLTQSIQNQQQ
ncbi:Rossmann-like and DUF2520 domain-containing protein [Pontibacter vulgaris]|uniref:Rossmann-like and DUF2520 domain-containing protein n=1 Tax=Pontibacter vulgaris TaxID=2905679 RepID=UPI001FA6F14D|nr:Rossmann-like and DUF2520 domain-containing protein [Pontibacter vulgaris]